MKEKPCLFEIWKDLWLYQGCQFCARVYKDRYKIIGNHEENTTHEDEEDHFHVYYPEHLDADVKYAIETTDDGKRIYIVKEGTKSMSYNEEEFCDYLLGDEFAEQEKVFEIKMKRLEEAKEFPHLFGAQE